jgi:hypothetical protein
MVPDWPLSQALAMRGRYTNVLERQRPGSRKHCDSGHEDAG